MVRLFTDHFLNKITRTSTHVGINTTDVLSQQTHADKLGANKGKQHGKQGEHPAARPFRAHDQTQGDQQYRQHETRKRNHAAHYAQQTQRRGGQTGDQVVHQINQLHQAVFRVAKLAFSVQHVNFSSTTGEGIRQDRDKGAALVAVQHRFDNVAAIGAQHAAIVAHRFTGSALDHHIDDAGGAFTEPGVLTVGAHSADHVVTLFRHPHQPRDLFRRVLQVSIQRDHQIAAHLIETGHDCRVLPIVAVQQYGNDATAGLFGGSGQHIGRIVAAAVIDQDNFIGLGQLFTGGGGTFKQGR
ncbi:hypothetical protein D3C79_462270 [compost metagenome]